MSVKIYNLNAKVMDENVSQKVYLRTENTKKINRTIL